MTKNIEDLARSAMALVLTYAELIQLTGEIPNGHLYAAVMPMGVKLEVHTQVLSILKDAHLVSESNYLLKWVGPANWTPPPMEPFIEHVRTCTAEESSTAE